MYHYFMKRRNSAIFLAIVLGGLGTHKFYLGNSKSGVFYLLFCWTFIPVFLGVFDGLVYLKMSKNDFDMKYNGFVNFEDFEKVYSELSNNWNQKLDLSDEHNYLKNRIIEIKNQVQVDVISSKNKLKSDYDSGIISYEFYSKEFAKLAKLEKDLL
jgi:TM2 domain-containing membrane protein YozV